MSVMSGDLRKTVSFTYIIVFVELDSFWEENVFRGYDFLNLLLFDPLWAVSV